MEEEQRQREEQHILASKAEKRANDLSVEVEDLRGSLEQVKELYNTFLYISHMHADKY